MTNYEEKMLAALADKYRKSKKDQGTNVIARRTKISPSLLYKQYSRNDGDPEEIQAVNQAAARCQEKASSPLKPQASAMKSKAFI